ncbi:hypothetical protein [Nocardia sp. CA-290969]|uniref:hypothetical protein n=1 Tax=Nocardia sp. CA-290969 TaxID=3239986 RepID=UPI003D925F1C
MVHIVSLEGVTASVGDVAGALAVMTESVGTTVDSLAVESKACSTLDRNMLGKLDWIRDTCTAAATEVTEQSGITVQAADFGTTKLRNADIDGGDAVRSATV